MWPPNSLASFHADDSFREWTDLQGRMHDLGLDAEEYVSHEQNLNSKYLD